MSVDQLQEMMLNRRCTEITEEKVCVAVNMKRVNFLCVQVDQSQLCSASSKDVEQLKYSACLQI